MSQRKLITSSDIQAFIDVLLKLENGVEAQAFLRDLLTEAEIFEFANRWKVARLLQAKVPYAEIEKQTGMSSTTIARISKWLQNGMGGYKMMLKKVQDIDKH